MYLYVINYIWTIDLNSHKTINFVNVCKDRNLNSYVGGIEIMILTQTSLLEYNVFIP